MAGKIQIVTLQTSNIPRQSNLKTALVHWRQVILFGLVWAAFLTIHTISKLFWDGWQDHQSILYLAFLIFTGTFIGGCIGWFTSIWFSAHRIGPKRFATTFVLILLFTIGVTAGLFALQYRIYYSQWHMSAFSIGWFYQVIFTGLSALYLFAVQGLRLLLPFSPLGLFIATAIFVKIAPKNNQIQP